MRTILIVEDERATAWALAQRFEEEGFTALTAGTAEEALRLLRTRRCALAIVDLRLPRMDGVELIRRLSRRRRPLPAIAVTAHGTPRLVRDVLGAGAQACFLKPFRVEQLVEGARQALAPEAA